MADVLACELKLNCSGRRAACGHNENAAGTAAATETVDFSANALRHLSLAAATYGVPRDNAGGGGGGSFTSE